ncbi:MAG: hypothetical protein ACO31E_06160 [Phycisphaerales bacterium]
MLRPRCGVSAIGRNARESTSSQGLGRNALVKVQDSIPEGLAAPLGRAGADKPAGPAK